MVKISKVYTKTGDDGSTGLIGGTRVEKDSLRVSAYGEIDELNSYLGLIRTLAEKSTQESLVKQTSIIQNELFDIGSLLATNDQEQWPNMPHIDQKQIERLEAWIDQITDRLPELKSFVLPGGTELNAHLHIARTICRRAERSIVKLSHSEKIAPNIFKYVNRLSDLLFCLARQHSFILGATEYLWKPGESK